MRYLPFLIFFLSYFASSAQKSRIKITPLSKNLYVFTTYINYKGALTDANGMYALTPNGVVVIDAPWDKADLQPFLDSIEVKHHQKVIIDIATHSHEDRAGGISFFKSKGIKTYASKMTDEILKASKKPQADFTFSKDTTFTLAGYKISTFYPGKGHTKDNLVVWFEKEKVLFGGCLVKSTEAKDLGFVGEADLTGWPKSIRKVQEKFPQAKTVVPGHQGWHANEGLNYTLKLLSKR